MHYTHSTWRIIEHPPATGAWNMAVDEAILEAVYTGQSPPTLRLYAWQPACLSLGLAQPYREVDLQALSAAGWDIVRRPTGGRAILHTDELTYAVIAPEDEPRVRGGILESYLRLSKALLAALQLLGLNPQAQEKSDAESGKPNPVCFEAPSNYEITVNGLKLIGSAQARRQGGVLQHGALPLEGDLTRIVNVLKFPDETERKKAKQRLLAHAATVEDVIGTAPIWQEASDAFKNAFQNKLNLHFQHEPLSNIEKKRTRELVLEKYNHPSWTKRT